jgi:hypothetical protein
MLLALLLLAAPLKIAVLDARTGPGVDPALGPYLAQILAQEVQSRTGAAPLLSADVTAMLGFERNKRMLGCTEEDSACLAEITGALGVQEVLASSVAIAGGRYLVSMSLLDPRHARPLKRTAESAPIDHDALLLVVRRSAWEIFGGPEPVIVAPAQTTAWRPTRRTWALVAGGGALALGGAGAIVGANALSQAHAGSPTALSRAHLADALFGVAVLAAGAGAYLWFTGSPRATVAVLPTGAMVAVAW